MSKEQVYDEQINPLMAQIIAICKEHKIANVCSFSLDREAGLCCTTAMTGDDFEPPDSLLDCVRVLFPAKAPPLFMTVRDADGNIKEHHAIMP